MPTPRTRPCGTAPPPTTPVTATSPDRPATGPAHPDPGTPTPGSTTSPTTSALAIPDPDRAPDAGPAEGPSPARETAPEQGTSTASDAASVGEPAIGDPDPSAVPDGRRPITRPDARVTTGPAACATAAGQVSDSAHDRVWAALRSHPGATAADLSAASGVSRSAVGKLLAAWSTDSSATAAAGPTPRAARVWTAAPSNLPPAPTTPDGHPEPAPAGHSTTGDADNADPASGGTTVPHTADRFPRTVNRSGTPRLAAGALQGMVEDYLTEHPGEHGPTAIGTAIGRSPGAVANALERMVATGAAVRTRENPKRYRRADQPDPTPHDAPDDAATTEAAAPR
jgi:hypothetical protein